MKYRRPTVYDLQRHEITFGICASGDQASSGVACSAGPDALGSCSHGANAVSNCGDGAAAGNRCATGTGQG